MKSYETRWREAKDKIRRMPTKKLLIERKKYNAEFKRFSLNELKKRGAIKTRKKKTNNYFIKSFDKMF